MRTFLLIYNPSEENTVEKKILPLFKEYSIAIRPYTPADEEPFPADTALITWLPDKHLTSLLPRVVDSGHALGLLPHPVMKQARLGFGISSRLDEAVQDILGAEKTTQVDVMHCNCRPVFNSVIIGDPFTVTPGTAVVEPFWRRLRRFASVLYNLTQMVPNTMKIATHNDNSVETATIGVVAVEHGRSSTLARRILSDSAVNDGMLNTLVFSPRSVAQMFWYLFAAMFLARRHTTKLPDFAGQIRTRAMTITAPEPIRYSVDGQPFTARQLLLGVAKQALRLYPGRHLGLDTEAPSNKEIFRVKGLPVGEVRSELCAAPLPLLHHASTEEFKELFILLKENARLSESYVILMVLSTFLATFGLFSNSAPVIIGAMILAPLMGPIVSLSMAVLRQQSTLALESGKTVLAGIGLTLLCAMLLTWLTPLETINSEIGARLSPTLLDLGVAVFSGIAAAYAHARSEVARSLAGVAIAVALVPPLAVAGIGIGWFDWQVFYGAFLLFITNLVGILLAAALTFLFLGYSAFGRAQRGLATSLVLVAIVSVPLALSFQAMVQEHNVIRELDNWQVGDVHIRDVRIRSMNPLHITVRLIAESPIEANDIDVIKVAIEERLEEPVQLEATLAVMR